MGLRGFPKLKSTDVVGIVQETLDNRNKLQANEEALNNIKIKQAEGLLSLHDKIAQSTGKRRAFGVELMRKRLADMDLNLSPENAKLFESDDQFQNDFREALQQAIAAPTSAERTQGFASLGSLLNNPIEFAKQAIGAEQRGDLIEAKAQQAQAKSQQQKQVQDLKTAKFIRDEATNFRKVAGAEIDILQQTAQFNQLTNDPQNQTNQRIAQDMFAKVFAKERMTDEDFDRLGKGSEGFVKNTRRSLKKFLAGDALSRAEFKRMAVLVNNLSKRAEKSITRIQEPIRKRLVGLGIDADELVFAGAVPRRGAPSEALVGKPRRQPGTVTQTKQPTPEVIIARTEDRLGRQLTESEKAQITQAIEQRNLNGQQANR